MHTRKHRVRRMRRVRRGNTRKMKGGGILDRLPVGIDSRNADGKPKILIPPSARADVESGRVSRETFPRLGSSDGFDKGKKMSKLRLNYILEPETRPPGWDNKKLEDHIVKTLELLPSNVQKGYVNPSNYEQYKSLFNKSPPYMDAGAGAGGSLALALALGVRQENLQPHKPLALLRFPTIPIPKLHDSDKVVLELAKLRPDYPKLPDIREIKQIIRNDFRDNWDFKYLCGHGVLAQELPQAIVPERTYIRFNSVAGCISYGKLAIDVFTGTQDEFLDKMTDYYINNTGPLESFNSKEEREELMEHTFPDDFCKRVKLNTNIYHPESKFCMPDNYNKQTIYMPGEKIPQQYISFKNDLPIDYFIKGLYDLPFSKSVSLALNKLGGAIKKLTPKDFEPYYYMYKLDEIEYTNTDTDPPTIEKIPNPNLMKDIIDKTLTLTQIFDKLPPVPYGKVRFLYISTCRAAKESYSSNVSEMRKAVATHARRFSLGSPISKSDQEVIDRIRDIQSYLSATKNKTDEASLLVKTRMLKYIADQMMTNPTVMSIFALNGMNTCNSVRCTGRED